MTTRRALTVSVAAGLLFLACGSDDGASGSPSGDSIPASVAPNASDPASADAPTNHNAPIDGFRAVASVDEVAGIWVPVEVAGEPVNAAGLGAYLRVVANDERVSVDGFDGCNGFGGSPTGVRPAFDDGRFAGMEFSYEMVGCDESVPVSPESDGMLFVSNDGDELLVDQLGYVESIRYQRVQAIPVDPRQAVREDESEAEEEERRAEEQAQNDAFEQAQLEDRQRIRDELPVARIRWDEAGVDTYTLRFEVASLMNDPSFPGRPVGGVSEIGVIDGVADENPWSESILGDTVEDWFGYIESQLDSHYLSVEFDADLGFPITIDSQPLDDAVTDQAELVAWIVFAELDVSA